MIGYDYVVVGNHVYVRLGSVPHDGERYAVFRFRPANGGPVPFGVVYADLARRGRFGVSCAPTYSPAHGGGDNWALELAGRAEAASGLQDAMAWADTGSEPFVISQLGYTRGIIATLRETLGPQALTEEDNMLLQAQADLGLKMASGAANSFMHGGIGGLVNFGAQTAVSTATTAVVYNIDKAFRPRTRVSRPGQLLRRRRRPLRRARHALQAARPRRQPAVQARALQELSDDALARTENVSAIPPRHLCDRFPAMAKSPCPISKTQFLETAEPVKITIGNSEIIADKREFSTGSFGWYYNGKTTVMVDGKPLSVQVGLNLTVVGSKEADR